MKNHKKIGLNKAWKLVFRFHHLIGFFLIALVTIILYVKGDIYWKIVKFQVLFRESDSVPQKEYCNLFSGKWVYDNKSYPSYKEKDCSFIEYGFACETYGRNNLKYQNWRWQPHQCDLPRFNGRAFLEKIRGKKLVYVGDSLNRNQWQSMLCLIESTLPLSSNKSLISKGNFYIFQEYNVTIAFYWSPFLVESNCDDMTSHRVNDRAIRIKAIEKHARHWTDADILVFDSFLWWLEPTMTILWGSFGSPDAIYKKTTTSTSQNTRLYEIALNTWSNWLEINVNRTKTKLYFMSLSPMHCRGYLNLEQHCYNQTEPILEEGYWGCPLNRDMMSIAESRIEKLQRRGLNMQYLNITQLSGYRKDAHPSIYRKFNRQITEDQLKNPESYSDCIHWCLPGVPDVWNEILYAYIMNPDKY